MAKRKTKTRRTHKNAQTDAKFVGYETEDWTDKEVTDVEVYENLRHYNYFNDTKDYVNWTTQWVKENRPQDLKAYKAAHKWRTGNTLGGFCKMALNNAELRKKDLEFVNRQIDRIISTNDNQPAKKNTVDPANRRSPAEIVKEKTSDFIGMIEKEIDRFNESDKKAHHDAVSEEFNLYEKLKEEEMPNKTALGIVRYYTPLKKEMETLLGNKTPKDLEEGYSNFKINHRKRFLKFIEDIISDAELYSNMKKAQRKPRAKKKKSVSAQTKSVKYQKASDEYKIASVDPASIVGATQVITFNTKYKVISVLKSKSIKGFEIKGTTIQNLDEEYSIRKTVRKPEEFLREISDAPKVKSRKLAEALKTKPQVVNGRLNDQTIILKTFK